MVLNKKQIERLLKSLEWMTTTLKWQYIQEKNLFGQEGEPEYSPELKDAIQLKNEIEAGLKEESQKCPQV